MKNKLTLACIVMLTVETICLFVPYCFVEKIVYHGHSTSEKNSVNVFGVSTEIAKLLAVFLILSLLAAILGFVIRYLKKQEAPNKFINFMPIISLVFLVILAFYVYKFAETDTVYTRYEWSINWLFYIIIALQVVSCVFGLLIQFEKTEKVKAIPVKIENINTIESAAEKIKQYKELLDLGIISQDEFDAKKKKMLGL